MYSNGGSPWFTSVFIALPYIIKQRLRRVLGFKTKHPVSCSLLSTSFTSDGGERNRESISPLTTLKNISLEPLHVIWNSRCCNNSVWYLQPIDQIGRKCDCCSWNASISQYFWTPDAVLLEMDVKFLLFLLRLLLVVKFISWYCMSYLFSRLLKVTTCLQA